MLLMLWVFHGGPPLKCLSGGEAGKSLVLVFSAAAGSVGSFCGGQGGRYPGFPLRWQIDAKLNRFLTSVSPGEVNQEFNVCSERGCISFMNTSELLSCG